MVFSPLTYTSLDRINSSSSDGSGGGGRSCGRSVDVSGAGAFSFRGEEPRKRAVRSLSKLLQIRLAASKDPLAFSDGSAGVPFDGAGRLAAAMGARAPGLGSIEPALGNCFPAPLSPDAEELLAGERASSAGPLGPAAPLDGAASSPSDPGGEEELEGAVSFFLPAGFM